MNRIKEARLSKNLKQSELAAKVHVKQNTLSNWETGRTEPDMDALRHMANILNVSVDYLLGNDEMSSNVLRVPVLGRIPAGIPIEAIEDISDWEELPRSYASGGREYFGLIVDGDSMYPTFLPGDTVIVKKTPVCNSGDICAVYVNGYDATLKQVRLDEINGTLTIVPLNPVYPPRTFTSEEIENLPVSIAGVVIELRRKVK